MSLMPAAVPLPTALVVDPDEDSRKLNAAILEPLGFEIEESEDGADALARALARPPGLVVTEARLPRIDGYTLCSMLRSDTATRTTPILVVTASALPTDIERARRAGADDVLAKPSTPDEIRERARALVMQSRGISPRPAAALDAQVAHAEGLKARAAGTRRRMMSRLHERVVTLTPPEPVPDLRCPGCDRALEYTSSFVGGVSAQFPEQWDTFACATCGTFEYRHRTRKLRRL